MMTFDRERRRPGWRRSLRGGLAGLMLAVPLGCPADGEPSGETGAEPTSETGVETDPEPTSDTGATTTDPSSTTDMPVEIPWSDVPCGEVMCSGTDVCVQPGVDCDYSPCRMDMEAEWIESPPECQPFPAACDPANPGSCLQVEYCGLSEFFSFENGLLECSPIALDCYCG